ncbi:MAG: hypothetical protein PWQ63_1796 [Methanolobus sp.]|nr:hypothetical protein [Methanolobus sp.]
MMNEVVLDLQSLVALSSISRISILKKLDERCMTVTELSKTEKLAKSTIHEHLEKLCDVELVEKKEGGYKWIYYNITQKGTILLHPEKKTKVLVLLSSSFLSFGCGFSYFIRFTREYLKKTYIQVEGSYDITFYLLIGFVLMSLSVILFYFSLRLWGTKKK